MKCTSSWFVDGKSMRAMRKRCFCCLNPWFGRSSPFVFWLSLIFRWFNPIHIIIGKTMEFVTITAFVFFFSSSTYYSLKNRNVVYHYILVDFITIFFLETWFIRFYHYIFVDFFYQLLPSGKHTKSYWKIAIEIVDFPIKNGDFNRQHRFFNQPPPLRTSELHARLQVSFQPLGAPPSPGGQLAQAWPGHCRYLDTSRLDIGRTNIWICIIMHLYTCVYIYTHVSIHIYIHVYISLYIYRYTSL